LPTALDQDANVPIFPPMRFSMTLKTHGKAGVDFITVHCGITQHSLNVLNDCGRLMGIVSRGGSLMAEWVLKNQAENPLYEDLTG
jgi:phosphomethylpyrimidine synthase